jgi:hypothetical protein
MSENELPADEDFPEVTERLRAFGESELPAGTASRALARARFRPTPRRWRGRWVVAAAVAGFTLGSVGLASAAVLPAPVQDAAHNALGAVGLHVPPGHQRYNDPATCLGGPYKNHGQYVRAHPNDANAGASPCGKPLKAVDPSKASDDGPKNHSSRNGPPPWAHAGGKKNGTNNDKHGANKAPEGDEQTRPDDPKKGAESPATTVAPTTTTEAPTTTTISSPSDTIIEPGP